jgi:hypothetical protein
LARCVSGTSARLRKLFPVPFPFGWFRLLLFVFAGGADGEDEILGLGVGRLELSAAFSAQLADWFCVILRHIQTFLVIREGLKKLKVSARNTDLQLFLRFISFC